MDAAPGCLGGTLRVPGPSHYRQDSGRAHQRLAAADERRRTSAHPRASAPVNRPRNGVAPADRLMGQVSAPPEPDNDNPHAQQGQHRFAGDQGFIHLRRQMKRPGVVAIPAVQKSHEEARVGDAGQDRLNPWRVDRLAGPSKQPGWASTLSTRRASRQRVSRP